MVWKKKKQKQLAADEIYGPFQDAEYGKLQ